MKINEILQENAVGTLQPDVARSEEANTVNKQSPMRPRGPIFKK